MAKIRTVKPELWEDEKLGKLKRDCRLTFLGLFNFADDQGVIKSNPVYIKSRIYPYDEDLRVNELKTWLDALVKARMLIPFEFKKEGYYVIRTFRDHQKIDQRYARYSISTEFVKRIMVADSNKHKEATPGTQCEHDGATSQEGEGDMEGDMEGRGNVPAQDPPESLESENPESYTPGAENPPPPVAPPPSSTGPPFETVHMYFRARKGTEEMATKFYNKYAGTGWMLNGSKVVNWPVLADNFVMNYKENEKKDGEKRKGGKPSGAIISGDKEYSDF